MLADIWTVFWRDWVVLKHRLAAFILSRMVAPFFIWWHLAGDWGAASTRGARLTLIF